MRGGVALDNECIHIVVSVFRDCAEATLNQMSDENVKTRQRTHVTR